MRWLLLPLGCLMFSVPVAAKLPTSFQSAGMTVHVEEAYSGLKIPWGFDFISEHQMIVTERHGRISLLDLKAKKLTSLHGLPAIYSSGQGGLLDVRLHPNFKKEPWVYITYSKKTDSGGVTVLARFQLQKNKLVKFNELLVTRSESSRNVHYGSRIAFDESGHLYFSVGDRGHRPNGQDLSTHAGTIIRLKLDGSVPEDNPFVGQKGALAEIYSYGHRNPQGLVYDRQYKRLWAIEHGPRGGDELNLISAGKNYGWAVISYGKEYWGPVKVGESTHKKGMEQPVYQYTPSIAPCGLELYSGKLFPKWKGQLFSGALALTHLNRIVLEGEKFKKQERLLESLDERIRHVRESPAGLIYLSTDSGRILRLSP